MTHILWLNTLYQCTRLWNSSSEASKAGAYDLIKSDKCDKSVTWQLLFARCINRVATAGCPLSRLSVFRTLNSIWCTTRPIWQLSAFLSSWFQLFKILNPPTQSEIISRFKSLLSMLWSRSDHSLINSLFGQFQSKLYGPNNTLLASEVSMCRIDHRMSQLNLVVHNIFACTAVNPYYQAIRLFYR